MSQKYQSAGDLVREVRLEQLLDQLINDHVNYQKKKQKTSNNVSRGESPLIKKKPFSSKLNQSINVSTIQNSQKLFQESPIKQIQEKMVIDANQKIAIQNLSQVNDPLIWNKILRLQTQNSLRLNNLPKFLFNREPQRQEYYGLSKEILNKLILAKCQDTDLSNSEQNQQTALEFFYQKSSKFVFDMSSNSLGEYSAIQIANILKSNYDFIRFNLSFNKINNKALRTIINALPFNDKLIHLDLSSNGLNSMDISYLVFSLIENPTLVSLDISNKDKLNLNRIGFKGALALKELFENNKILQIFRAQYCCIDDEQSSYIFKGLQNNQSLDTLDFTGNLITNYCFLFENVLNTCMIQRLYIASNPIVDDFVDDLIKMKYDTMDNKKLKALHFGSNFIQQKQGKFFKALQLDKVMTELYNDKIKWIQKDFYQICDFLAENKSLLKLSLVECNLHEQGGLQIADGLSQNKTLQYINLNNNIFGDIVCAKIMESVQNHPCLREIKICKNGFSSQAVQALIKVICGQNKIETLDLKENQINNFLARNIIQKLGYIQVNIDITHCQVDQYILDELKDKLIENQKTRNNVITKNYVQQINEVKQQNDEDNMDLDQSYQQINQNDLIIKRLKEEIKQDKLVIKQTEFDANAQEQYNNLQNKMNQIIAQKDKIELQSKKIDQEIQKFNDSYKEQVKVIQSQIISIQANIQSMEQQCQNIYKQKEKKLVDLEKIRQNNQSIVDKNQAIYDFYYDISVAFLHCISKQDDQKKGKKSAIKYLNEQIENQEDEEQKQRLKENLQKLRDEDFNYQNMVDDFIMGKNIPSFRGSINKFLGNIRKSV